VYAIVAVAAIFVFLAALLYFAGNIYFEAQTHRNSNFTARVPSTINNPFQGMSGPFKITIACNPSHSWIDVTHLGSGTRHTFGRWARGFGDPPSEYGGVHIDKELTKKSSVSRTRTIRTFVPVLDKGYDEWFNNCSSYAAEMWSLNTGESIDSNYIVAWDMPSELIEEIKQINGGKDHYELP
jgi:hypothetical protein